MQETQATKKGPNPWTVIGHTLGGLGEGLAAVDTAAPPPSPIQAATGFSGAEIALGVAAAGLVAYIATRK